MVCIVDYGVGNLFSLRSSFAAVGIEATVSSDRGEIEKADRIVLPGVGAFADAAEKLRLSGLDELICEQAQKKPLLGICLGMQLLFDRSLEYGDHKGLGLLRGSVVPIADSVPKGYKIPHIGWNALKIIKPCPLYKYVGDGSFVYFVHSYHATGCDASVTAVAEYGAPVTASVWSGNVYGCQFHPEKSGEVGLNILKAFAETEAVVC